MDTFPTDNEWSEIARQMEKDGLLTITLDPETDEEIWALTEKGIAMAAHTGLFGNA